MAAHNEPTAADYAAKADAIRKQIAKKKLGSVPRDEALPPIEPIPPPDPGDTPLMKLAEAPARWLIQRELRGKNLACWCKAGETCHADVLLGIANGEEVSDGGRGD